MKCFILVGTFSASKKKKKKNLCELCFLVHRVLYRDLANKPGMKRVYNMGKYGLMSMMVLKLMCNYKKWATQSITKGSQSVQLDVFVLDIGFQKRQPFHLQASSNDVHATLCTNLHICLISVKISKYLYTHTNQTDRQTKPCLHQLHKCDKSNDCTLQLTYNCNYSVQNTNTNKNYIIAALTFSN